MWQWVQGPRVRPPCLGTVGPAACLTQNRFFRWHILKWVWRQSSHRKHARGSLFGASVADTVNKTACPRRSIRSTEWQSTECQGIDQGDMVILTASYHSHGQCETGASAGGWARFGDALPAGCNAARHRSEVMSTFGAVCIAGREVKFLDPRGTNRSEGVQQVCDCRSRTRVWGSKMIRCRRSPRP